MAEVHTTQAPGRGVLTGSPATCPLNHGLVERAVPHEVLFSFKPADDHAQAWTLDRSINRIRQCRGVLCDDHLLGCRTTEGGDVTGWRGHEEWHMR